MNKIIVFLISFFFVACTNTSQEKAESTTEHVHSNSTSILKLNKEAKWKTDEATRQNVVAIEQVVNDSIYANGKNKVQFVNQLQVKLDTLVQQCKMTGPDHDALHMWLGKVLHDVKEIKEDENEHEKRYTALKKDVESFHDYFE
jgi:rubrerythrin